MQPLAEALALAMQSSEPPPAALRDHLVEAREAFVMWRDGDRRQVSTLVRRPLSRLLLDLERLLPQFGARLQATDARPA